MGLFLWWNTWNSCSSAKAYFMVITSHDPACWVARQLSFARSLLDSSGTKNSVLVVGWTGMKGKEWRGGIGEVVSRLRRRWYWWQNYSQYHIPCLVVNPPALIHSDLHKQNYQRGQLRVPSPQGHLWHLPCPHRIQDRPFQSFLRLGNDRINTWDSKLL